jgi:hypothetical protein
MSCYYIILVNKRGACCSGALVSDLVLVRFQALPSDSKLGVYYSCKSTSLHYGIKTDVCKLVLFVSKAGACLSGAIYYSYCRLLI